MRAKKRAMLKDYKIYYGKNGNMNVAYAGEKFIFSNPPFQLARIRILLAVLLTMSAILFVGTTFLDTPSSYEVYVVLPSVGILIPIVCCFIYAAPLLLGETELTLIKKDKLSVKLGYSLTSALAVAIFAIIGRMLYFILKRDNYSLLNEILIMSSSLIATALIIISRKLASKICITTQNMNK